MGNFAYHNKYSSLVLPPYDAKKRAILKEWRIIWYFRCEFP